MKRVVRSDGTVTVDLGTATYGAGGFSYPSVSHQTYGGGGSKFDDVMKKTSNLLSREKPVYKEEPVYSVEDQAATIENLIADFLPDSDKDLPRKIAVAVVEELRKGM